MRAVLVAVLLAAAASAHAQQYRGLYQARQAAAPVTAPSSTGQLPAGYRVAARTGVGAPVTSSASTKPFTHVAQTPVISPYINLFREETENAAPNYHVFVQPQLQQQQLLQSQQQQLLQLQRRVQATAQPPQSQQQTQTFGGARYGNLGHYYGGFQR